MVELHCLEMTRVEGGFRALSPEEWRHLSDQWKWLIEKGIILL